MVKEKKLSKHKIDFYLSIIDEIENVRSKNNVNWMEILRVAFKNAPEEALDIMKKIDKSDNKISELMKKFNEK